MRTPLVILVAALAGAGIVTAQTPIASPAAAQAKRFYADGWSAIRAQQWDIAKLHFQRAIESDPKFALAYYSLGRAEMGLRDYDAAIEAYVKCRGIYQNIGIQQFRNQTELRQYLADRVLEYRAALEQAQTRAANARSNTQSQSLYIRELQTQIHRLRGGPGSPPPRA